MSVREDILLYPLLRTSHMRRRTGAAQTLCCSRDARPASAARMAQWLGWTDFQTCCGCAQPPQNHFLAPGCRASRRCFLAPVIFCAYRSLSRPSQPCRSNNDRTDWLTDMLLVRSAAPLSQECATTNGRTALQICCCCDQQAPAAQPGRQQIDGRTSSLRFAAAAAPIRGTGPHRFTPRGLFSY
jgi:hypothetical protein